MKARKLYCKRGSIVQQTDAVLNLLRQGDSMSVQELMVELDLTKNELLTSLDRLEREGEIDRRQGRYKAIRG